MRPSRAESIALAPTTAAIINQFAKTFRTTPGRCTQTRTPTRTATKCNGASIQRRPRAISIIASHGIRRERARSTPAFCSQMFACPGGEAWASVIKSHELSLAVFVPLRPSPMFASVARKSGDQTTAAQPRVLQRHPKYGPSPSPAIRRFRWPLLPPGPPRPARQRHPPCTGRALRSSSPRRLHEAFVLCVP